MTDGGVTLGNAYLCKDADDLLPLLLISLLALAVGFLGRGSLIRAVSIMLSREDVKEKKTNCREEKSDLFISPMFAIRISNFVNYKA